MIARRFSFVICYTLFGLFAADAQVKLPRLIRDSMILQRDTKLKIWGWAAKDERVTIIVSSSEGPDPAYVRYAWDDNPDVNFYNTEGLPPSPFGTDANNL